MKMELKKALSLILAFALILTLGISTGVYFDDEVNVNAADSETGSCGDNFTYTISGTTLYIDDDGTLSEAAEMTDYTINTVTGKSTAPWYASYYSTITTVIIQSEYLSNIGNAAFAGMTALTNVVINSDNSELVTIGNYAFYNCTALTTFAKGDDSGTLADTSEDSEIVLDDATSIGTCAFCGCSEITRVRLGASIASIGASAFSGCSDLYLVDFTNRGENTSTSLTSLTDTTVFFHHCSGDLAIVTPATTGFASITSDDDTIEVYATINAWQLGHTHVYSSSSSTVCYRCGYTNPHRGHLTYYAAVAAGCASSGNSAYYKCSHCGKCFDDNTASGSGYSESHYKISQLTTAGKHTLTYVGDSDATCTTAGTYAHYECSVCGKLFTDYNATTETTSSAVTISKLGHSKVKQTTSSGYVYYYCSRCFAVYSNYAFTKEIDWLTVVENGGELPADYVSTSTDSSDVEYTVETEKSVQTISGLTTSKTIKYSTLKKKSVGFYIGGESESEAGLKYKKLCNSKGGKKIKVNSTTGRVTVPKGLAKGTYKLKVRVRAVSTDEYYGQVETVKIKIVVK